jgi:hypothetical protein
MTKMCDDCFEDFETEKEDVVICPTCLKLSKTTRYKNSGVTADIWKVCATRGFESKEQLGEYQIVKKDHKILTGYELPELKEIVK